MFFFFVMSTVDYVFLYCNRLVWEHRIIKLLKECRAASLMAYSVLPLNDVQGGARLFLVHTVLGGGG